MKKLIAFTLVLLCIFSFSSCSSAKSRPSTVNFNFYYMRNSIEYNKTDGMICAENRKITDASSDEEWINIINLYLKGTNKDNFISPFPEGTEFKRYSTTGNTLTLFLSHQISQLEGYDLTLACACLAKTVLETKPVHEVEIRAEGGKMGDFISITMTQENLLLLDNYTQSEQD